MTVQASIGDSCVPRVTRKNLPSTVRCAFNAPERVGDVHTRKARRFFGVSR
jgi:hypothetical protein